MARFIACLSVALYCTAAVARPHNMTGLNTLPYLQARDNQPTLDIDWEIGAGESSFYQYDIKIRRFGCTDCHCEPLGKGKLTLVHQNECRTWGDDMPFHSWQYAWPRALAYTRKHEDYGECQIQAWKGKGCTGEVVHTVENVGYAQDLCDVKLINMLGELQGQRRVLQPYGLSWCAKRASNM